MTYQIENKMKLGGGCIPLYSSKSSRQEYHETRRKYQQVQKFPYQFHKIARIKTLVYQAISIHMQKTSLQEVHTTLAPQYTNTSIQKMLHKREIDPNSQRGRKFQPSSLLK
jgi:hypothetical protein